MLYMDKLDLIQNYLRETEGITPERVSFNEDGNNIDVKYWIRHNDERRTTIQLFDLVAYMFYKNS